MRKGDYRFGVVAVLGRPNVGKSTLVNRIVGRKVSITSPRPQTTRHRIMGIRSRDDAQIVFIDTPGLHEGGKTFLNRIVNRAAAGSLEGVDCALCVVEASGLRPEDAACGRMAAEAEVPALLAINKVDRLRRRDRVLPVIAEAATLGEFAQVVPVSARDGYNVEHLVDVVAAALPRGPPGFPADQLTDRGRRFMSGELVREQLFRQLADELPYATAVEIETFEDDGDAVRVGATIWVDRAGQKPIVVGRGGERIKRIGEAARAQMERLLGARVRLDLWVKVRKGWADSARALRSLGYVE